MKPWLATPFILPFLLTGCSFSYDLVTFRRGDAIVIAPQDKQGSGCIGRLTVTSETGELVWEVTNNTYSPPPCETRFPVIYGTAPAGLWTEVEAAPLRPGVAYKVYAWDGDGYTGTFRLGDNGAVEDID